MSWLTVASKAANKPKHSITASLMKKMARYEEARPISVVHASDITRSSFCPRQWAFYDLLKVKPSGQYVGTALRATFNLGHATAKELVENWADGIAVGNWKCKTCNAMQNMTVKPPNGCKTHIGSACHWEYQEVSFQSQEYGVSGSLDVLFDLGANKLALTELKTYAANEFDKMVAPLPEHRTRTKLYLKIIADSGHPYANRINLHEARIFYVSRGYGKMNAEHGEILPFREFVVEREDDEPDLAFALKKAKQVKLFREQGQMPSGICGTPLDKTAKSCKQCQICFSGQYPAVQEPL